MVSYAVNHGDMSSPAHGGPGDMSAAGDIVTLKRTGKQPLRFKGRQIVEATGHSTEGRLWHEVNIWSKVNTGEFVVDLRVFKKGQGEKDIFHAETCSSMAEAAAFLESYDPKTDININVDTDDKTISTAELTLKAVALRQRLEESDRLYQSLLGDMLYQLDISDEFVD